MGEESGESKRLTHVTANREQHQNHPIDGVSAAMITTFTACKLFTSFLILFQSCNSQKKEMDRETNAYLALLVVAFVNILLTPFQQALIFVLHKNHKPDGSESRKEITRLAALGALATCSIVTLLLSTGNPHDEFMTPIAHALEDSGVGFVLLLARAGTIGFLSDYLRNVLPVFPHLTCNCSWVDCMEFWRTFWCVLFIVAICAFGAGANYFYMIFWDSNPNDPAYFYLMLTRILSTFLNSLELYVLYCQEPNLFCPSESNNPWKIPIISSKILMWHNVIGTFVGTGLLSVTYYFSYSRESNISWLLVVPDVIAVLILFSIISVQLNICGSGSSNLGCNCRAFRCSKRLVFLALFGASSLTVHIISVIRFSKLAQNGHCLHIDPHNDKSDFESVTLLKLFMWDSIVETVMTLLLFAIAALMVCGFTLRDNFVSLMRGTVLFILASGLIEEIVHLYHAFSHIVSENEMSECKLTDKLLRFELMLFGFFVEFCFLIIDILREDDHHSSPSAPSVPRGDDHVTELKSKLLGERSQDHGTGE